VIIDVYDRGNNMS